MSERKRIPTRKEFEELHRLIYLMKECAGELANRVGAFLPMRFADKLCRFYNNDTSLSSALDDLACRVSKSPSAIGVFYGSAETAGVMAREYIGKMLADAKETLPADFLKDQG